MSEPFGGPAPQLVYGQLGAESRTYVLRDGIHVGDTAGNDRVHLGQLPSGDYGLEVTNPGGTVIIDGTSNMFKIQATGTFSHTVADNTDLATTTVTLSGLGALPTTPAHLGYIAGANTVGAKQANAYAQNDASDFVANTSGGATNQARVMATIVMRLATYLNGSNEAVVESRMSTAGVGASTTWFARYYVLKEAAL